MARSGRPTSRPGSSAGKRAVRRTVRKPVGKASVRKTAAATRVKPAIRPSVVDKFRPSLIPKIWRIEALRVDDFLALDFFLHNLKPDPRGGAAIRANPAKPAYLVAQFQGQAFGEQAFDLSGSPATSETPTSPPGTLAKARLAGPSRLAFKMPPLQGALPLSLEAFLEACRTWPMSLDALAAPIPPGFSDDLPGGGFTAVFNAGALAATTLKTMLETAGFSETRADLTDALHGAKGSRIARAANLAGRAITNEIFAALRRGEVDEDHLATFADRQVSAWSARSRVAARDREMVRALVDAQVGASLAKIDVTALPGLGVGALGKIPGLQFILKPHKPSTKVTAIEAPYRLFQSPIEPSAWTHADGPVPRGTRTELWHTRLAPKTGGVADEETDRKASLRALWSPDYKILSPINPFKTTLTPRNRSDIVRLTAGYDEKTFKPDTETAASDVELVREDLIRGYHVDILDVERGRWQSLCRRDGLIDLLDTLDDITVKDEEGTVRLGVTQAADGEEADIVKLYEGLYAWTGWSLSAPQPGLAIDTDDSVAPLSNTAPPGMTFQTNFRPHKGSLPSLRYGRKYRMRVRVADLALNAEPWAPGDVHPKPAESPEVRYLRYEPVEPPAMALGRTGGVAEKPGDGEAMARIAVRTFNDDPADNTVPVTVTERRHIVASRTSVKQAETHGRLDDANGRVDPATYGMLGAQDMPLESATLSFEGVESAFPVASDGFVLPYLPDPFAHAVATRFLGPADVGVPSLPDVEYYPEPGDVWPAAQPFQIRILEDPNAVPEFDKATRTLNVPLAKGDIVRLRLSHVLPEGVLDQMGVWQWFLDRAGNNQTLIDEVRKRALAGGNWTLTPWTEIELVHAVQKPLVKPEIIKLGVGRPLGATAARMTFLTPADSHSTDKLDLFGRWNEPEDPRDQAGPRSLIRRGHAHERKLDYGEAAGMNPPGLVRYRRIEHEFGDTRYRRVLYRLEATTRFREFMPPAIRAPLVDGETNPQLKVISDETVGWVPNSAPPPAPDVLYVIPTFGWTRRKVGKEQRSWRDGGGLRVYLNRPWFVSGHNEMLAVVTPPDNATTADIDGPLKPFVTQWGTDPIWASTNIKTPSPGLSAFPMALKAGPLDPARLPDFVPEEEADLPSGPFPLSNLPNPTLPDTSPLRVNVAPHAVGYDEERQLWYCDIVVDPGKSYFPFIRLALARYHPVSAPRAHLSPIVTTEFLQLTPDRFATVAPTKVRKQYTVGVYGHAYTSGPGAASPSTGAAAKKPIVKITVEHLDEALGEDFGWKTLPGVSVKRRRGRVVRPKASRITATSKATRTNRVSASRRNVSSGAATANAALQRKADRLLAARDYTAIVKNPGILSLLKPPAIWEGTVTLSGILPADGKYRLVIREYERHEVDTDHVKIPIGGPDPRMQLVYAETVALT